MEGKFALDVLDRVAHSHDRVAQVVHDLVQEHLRLLLGLALLPLLSVLALERVQPRVAGPLV